MATKFHIGDLVGTVVWTPEAGVTLTYGIVVSLFSISSYTILWDDCTMSRVFSQDIKLMRKRICQ
jgi:uncharacterized membrane protein